MSSNNYTPPSWLQADEFGTAAALGLHTVPGCDSNRAAATMHERLV